MLSEEKCRRVLKRQKCNPYLEKLFKSRRDDSMVVAEKKRKILAP